MSVDYSCGVTLEAEFSKKNIEKILKRGFELNFIFYKEALSFLNTMDVSEALKTILSCPKGEPNSIYTKIDDAVVSILFGEKEKNLSISFLFLRDYWIKIRRNTNYIFFVDVARYLKVLFNLCEGFKIKKIRSSRF